MDNVQRISTIQYLRAAAATMVVLHHALDVPGAIRLPPLGNFGVDLFFVISGYIMWTTTAGGQRSPVEFWRARLLRIVPLYWFFTTLYLATAILLPGALKSEAVNLAFIAKSYLFIPAVNPVTGDMHPLFGVGWTLNYEMFFYLVFGASLFISAPWVRVAAVLGALTALVLAGFLLPPRDAVLSFYANPVLLQFAAGILLGLVSQRLCDLGPRIGTVLIAIGLAVVATLMLGIWKGTAAHLAGATLLVAGGLAVETQAAQHPAALALLLGNASYSIYLAHPFVLRPLRMIFVRLFEANALTTTAYVTFATAAGVAGGVVSYLVLERRLFRAQWWSARAPDATGMPSPQPAPLVAAAS